MIERGKTRSLQCYTETHHVIPTCIGGPDTPENRVELTPEEHYVAHQLLVKIHPGVDSLIYAATMMTSARPTNKFYGWLKRKLAEVARRNNLGEKNFMFGKMWITDGSAVKAVLKSATIPPGWRKGFKPLSLRTKNLISQSIKGRRLSVDHIAKIAASHRGKKFTNEHKAAIASSSKGRKWTPEIKAKLKAEKRGPWAEK